MKIYSAFVSLACCASFAQTVPDREQPAVRTQSNAVLIPALVKSADGTLVFTLKADDFRLTDNGVEQKLTLDEDNGSQPLALVVAVETGAAGARRLETYRNLNGVIAAIAGGGPHEVAVVAFDSTPHLVQDFDPEVDSAAAALNDLEKGDRDAAILDALAYSIDQLRREPLSYRRAILLISETLDRGSQASMDNALRAIGDTNTAIYAVAFSSLRADSVHQAARIYRDDTPGPAHGCMARDPNAQEVSSNRWEQAFDCLGLLAPPLRIAKLAAVAAGEGLQRNVPETVAQLTGGEYFHFENRGSLVRNLVTISNHLPNQYALSFQPQQPHPGFHAIELRLKDRPDLHVSARSGYWVDAAASAAP